MPVDYASVDAIAAAVADIYAEAENALLAMLTRQLSAGGFEPDTTTWAARKLREIRALQRTAALLVDELQRDGNTTVRQAVTDGFRSGNATALTDLAQAQIGDIGPAARAADQGAGTAIQALADAVVEELRPVHAAVLRSTDDAYRKAVAGATARRLAGARDTRRAAQDAWAALARQGITGFVDKAGRRWALHTYAEMATRAAVARAAITGAVDTWQAAGIDRCYVVDNPRECPLCVIPGTLVEGPVPEWACRLEYTGDVISIRTASGKDLTGTPDHTVLTVLGWRRLKDLAPGDKVVSQRREHGVAGVVPHHVEVPTRIEEFAETGTPLLATGPARRDLDGNTAYREVHDVRAGGHLLPEIDAALSQPGRDLGFVLRVGTAAPLLGGRDPHAALARHRTPPQGLMGGAGPLHPLIVGGVVPAGSISPLGRLGSLLRAEPGNADMPRARLYASTAQVVADAARRDPEGRAELFGRLAGLVAGDELGGLFGGQFDHLGASFTQRHPGGDEDVSGPGVADTDGGARLMQGLAGEVAPDEVLSISVRQYSGHVWDLQTVPRWFLTNGIVTHNCRPWEGKVLQLSGPPVSPAAATLDQAQAAGLNHPNCRHELRLWTPDTRIVAARNPEGPQGYEAEQAQRGIERKIRAWRARYAAAFDDPGRQAAAKKIAGYTAQLATHLHDNPRLPRKSYREHVGAGFMAPRAARTRRDAAHLRSRG